MRNTKSLTRMRYPIRALRGVTLVELLTVMVILGILASIAISSYRRYLLRANRADATTTLLRIQVAQEKYFLQNNAYANTNAAMTAAPPAGLGIGGTTTPNGRYTVNLAAGATAGTTYLATATATGGQTQDTAACLTFTINDQGQRTPAENTGCWH